MPTSSTSICVNGGPYYRARYYDPNSGRFLSEDPLAFGGGRNFYAYTGNNPVVFTDPSGLKGKKPKSKVCRIPPIGPHSKLPTPITRCASGQLVGCLIQTESNGDPDAVSSAGAHGLMQVTPITLAAAAQHGLVQPGMNTDDIGHAYLDLLITYCENTTYALAAYNAGPTAVNKAGGIPHNPETQNYVHKIDKCLKQQLHVKGGVNDPSVTGECCK